LAQEVYAHLIGASAGALDGDGGGDRHVVLNDWLITHTTLEEVGSPYYCPAALIVLLSLSFCRSRAARNLHIRHACRLPPLRLICVWLVGGQVFIRLARAEETANGSYSKRKTAWHARDHHFGACCGKKGAVEAEPTPAAEHAALDVDAVFTDNALGGGAAATGRPRPLRATVRKNLTLFGRQRGVLACVIGLPLVVIVAGALMQALLIDRLQAKLDTETALIRQHLVDSCAKVRRWHAFGKQPMKWARLFVSWAVCWRNLHPVPSWQLPTGCPVYVVILLLLLLDLLLQDRAVA
jgi:hypothetical protein